MKITVINFNKELDYSNSFKKLEKSLLKHNYSYIVESNNIKKGFNNLLQAKIFNLCSKYNEPIVVCDRDIEFLSFDDFERFKDDNIHIFGSESYDYKIYDDIKINTGLFVLSCGSEWLNKAVKDYKLKEESKYLHDEYFIHYCIKNYPDKVVFEKDKHNIYASKKEVDTLSIHYQGDLKFNL